MVGCYKIKVRDGWIGGDRQVLDMDLKGFDGYTYFKITRNGL